MMLTRKQLVALWVGLAVTAGGVVRAESDRPTARPGGEADRKPAITTGEANPTDSWERSPTLRGIAICIAISIPVIIIIVTAWGVLGKVKTAKVISFLCYNCNSALQVPSESAGQTVQCGRCSQLLKVPPARRQGRAGFLGVAWVILALLLIATIGTLLGGHGIGFRFNLMAIGPLVLGWREWGLGKRHAQWIVYVSLALIMLSFVKFGG